MSAEGLPPGVRAVTEAYQATIDRLVPGLVTGLYLTGSVALPRVRAAPVAKRQNTASKAIA